METEKSQRGPTNCTCPAPCKIFPGTLKKVSFIDAEFANEVLEIRAEMWALQQKIETIEPGFNPEQWLAERGL
jgi:hypothetical protein